MPWKKVTVGIIRVVDATYFSFSSAVRKPIYMPHLVRCHEPFTT